MRELEGTLELQEVARAVLASKQARSAKVRVQRRISLREFPDALVSIDVETNAEGDVLEVGCVAFSRSDGAILGVHHSLADGVIPKVNFADADEFGDEDGGEDSGGGGRGFCVLTLCGFESIDDDAVAVDQGRIRTELGTWLRRFPDHALVQWGGSDASALGLRDARSLDALALFRVWLEGQATKRKSCLKLGDAVEQLLGPKCMVPHRAFEDCVGTMMVLVAISE
jgi:hypothetical protein